MGVSWLQEASSPPHTRLAKGCWGAAGAGTERLRHPFIEQQSWGQGSSRGAGQWLHGQLLQEMWTQGQAGEGASRASIRAYQACQSLTMMALTMSLWLSLRALTALALDTLACAITSSMSRSSSPDSSTWRGQQEVLGLPLPRRSLPPLPS